MEQKTIVADDEENIILEWEYRLPFLHIPLLKKILMALGIPIFITATILAIRIRILNGLIIMLIVASIFAVGVVVAAFICRNGFYFTFRLTAGGIWSHMDERE